MQLFVGLGNPGAKYARNRHNIGFMAVDEIARRHGFAPWRRRFQGETSEGSLDGERVILLKPTTYMNDSGRAVQEAANFFKLGSDRITVFQDELELPPAKVRVKVGGGIAGHNGLRSISSHIGNEYRRDRSPRRQGAGARLCARRFRQGRCGLGERAVRGSCRQRRAACNGPRLDVPEQGASVDAGKGIFQGRRRRTIAHLVIAGLDPAIHLFKRGWMPGSSPGMTKSDIEGHNGIQMRDRRPAQCRQVDAVQCADGDGGRASR
jgi:peptidyl-tRNA hydrolase